MTVSWTIVVFTILLILHGCLGLNGKDVLNHLKFVATNIDENIEFQNTEVEDIKSTLSYIFKQVSGDDTELDNVSDKVTGDGQSRKRRKAPVDTQASWDAYSKNMDKGLAAMEARLLRAYVYSCQTADVLSQNENKCIKELQKISRQLFFQNDAIINLQLGQSMLYTQYQVSSLNVHSLLEHVKYLYNSSFTAHGEESSVEDATDMDTALPKSCQDLKGNMSGQYVVYPNFKKTGVKVYCNVGVDGGGWTVFQKRQDGSIDFYRKWADYKNGFGDLDGEFWLGNDIMHGFTNEHPSELRIDLIDVLGNRGYANYYVFKIGSEEAGYKLHVEGYSGTIGDSLGSVNGMMFSTKDRDNDKWSSKSCAEDKHGAWWFKHCSSSNLNGDYFDFLYSKAPYWYSWHNSDTAMKFTEMKLRWKY